MMKNIWKNVLAFALALTLVLGAALADEIPTVAEVEAPAETAETAETADPAETADAAAGAEATEVPQADPVLLATVNGQEIWSDNKAMQDLIEYYTEFYASYGYDTTEASLHNLLQAAGMEWAVESVLYTQKAQELNVADMTEEQRVSLEQDAKAEWDAAVEYYMQNVGGLKEDATEEEKAAARQTALDYIQTNLGFNEETYLNSYVEGFRESKMRENVQKAVLGEVNVTDMTEEQRASLEKAGKAEWDAAVEYYMQNVGNLKEDATEEEKAAARQTALDYIQTNFGYNEEVYLNSYIEGFRESQMRENVQKAVLGEVNVTDEEIVAHFNELVDEDKTNYENNIANYEYTTHYMNQPSYYVPEGYRGITHILLDVDDELMNNYKNLTASLEEQEEKATADESTDDTAEADADEAVAEVPAETAEAPAEVPTETAEAPAEATEAPAEPVTQEMVDAARQAILDSVKDKVDEIKAKYEAGTPFADLVAEYGTDPGMTVEPNKTNGYAVHSESILFDPAFKEGAMALEKIGDISEPVLGSYGVHILHYTRDIPAGAVELTDEIRATLKEELQSELEQAAVSAMMADWLSSADIQYTEDGQQLKSVLEANNTENESVEATEATEELLGEDGQ